MDKLVIIEEGLNNWAAYFRRKLTRRVSDMYKEKFLPYQKTTLRKLFKERIDYGEKFPFIHEVVEILQRLEELPINYDKTEDRRFPIGKLWEGFRVLEKHGKNTFYNFCNTSRMPLNDRERVIQKYNMAYSVKKTANGLFKDT